MSNYKNSTTYDKQHYRTTKNLFTAIPTYFIRDKEVDGYMMAILLILLSNSEDYIINKKQIMKIVEFPREKFNAAWNKLIEKGYIIKRRIHRGVNWYVTDNPDNIEDWRGNVAEEAVEYLKKGLQS